MDDRLSFLDVLDTAGFPPTTRTAILEFCCENLRDLARLPSKDLDSAIANLHKALANVTPARDRVRLNATRCITLHSIRMQCLDRLNCDAPYTANDIANLTPNDVDEARNEYLESTLSDSTTKGLGEVTIPKLIGSKWMEFKTAMTESLSRIIGKNKIPLTYLIREAALGIFHIPYNNRMERLIACTVHRGAAFTSDNGDLYSLIVQHTESTEGYALVQVHERRRNGRQAWLDLMSHFEGATYIERTAQEAGQAIRSATYNGPKRNFTFGDYYNRHSRAHIKLLKAGKPMTVEQQIDAFVQGIHCPTTQAIVVNLAGNQAVRTTFDNYYNAVASKLELAMTLTGRSSNSVTRNVNQVSKTTNVQKRKSGDTTSNTKSKKAYHGFKAEARRYSADEWKALTPDQKTQVKALHKIIKNNRTGAGNSVNSVATANDGALVPYVPNTDNNHVGQYNRVNTIHTVPHNAYPNSFNRHGFQPQFGRTINQMTYQSHYNAPAPSVLVPPPPPARTGTSSTGSLTADSGEVGTTWGGPYYSQNNNN